jgi:hypothetical protein
VLSRCCKNTKYPNTPSRIPAGALREEGRRDGLGVSLRCARAAYVGVLSVRFVGAAAHPLAGPGRTQARGGGGGGAAASLWGLFFVCCLYSVDVMQNCEGSLSRDKFLF